jgi:hypothetical protein
VQEVLCDLVLVDAILRRNAGATVTLHVKDAPVFVSDVTEKDVGWLVGGGPGGNQGETMGFWGEISNL